MNLERILAYLRAERTVLDAAIKAVEELAAQEPTRDRPKRGRKSMPPEERLLVSKRMRDYWNARRGKTAGGKSSPTNGKPGHK
jgi:hypothetical protein